MKLFTYATSPYARKVRMALDYKGVSYEPLERCYSIDRKEDLCRVNPRAEVPTLVLDDGRTITDSTIIAYARQSRTSRPWRRLCPNLDRSCRGFFFDVLTNPSRDRRIRS
ncbi:MAG: glutathione S-transferase N-terminal domain-containing protein [Deltaproteobacteria bacterium]|nr:glutathione S-transferase N-terminal domain-containing protein [Deltaproteobacteria bacterium]